LSITAPLPTEPNSPKNAADPPPETAALKECDLVMKGGITSGIVYPPLVIKLKDRYRFRSVGGTSAGAIAAAATAAAEHGRESGGFARLVAVNERLASDGFLRSLFQPSPETRPLFDTAVALLGLRNQALARQREQTKGAPEGAQGGPMDALNIAFDVLPRTSPEAYQRGARAGLLYAIAAAICMALFASTVFFVAAGLSIGWAPAVRPAVIAFFVLAILPATGLAFAAGKIGGVVQSAVELYRIATDRVPKSYFGVCTGRTMRGEAALTDWLGDIINELAGLPRGGRPLTFGDLWKTRDPAAERAIDLRMVTSNVSQHQPYVMPFGRDLFVFKKSDIDALFPENIADHMIATSREARGFKLPPGYHFLPAAADLPVMFATRMSMSFPVLISMVPLYTLSHGAFDRAARFDAIAITDDAGGRRECVELRMRDASGQWVLPEGEAVREVAEEHLKVNWFSDGGLCSNFPIHFFDAWLPTRPTFGVNLTTQLGGADTFDPESMKAAYVRDRSCYAVQQAADEASERGTAHREARYGDDVYLPRPDGDPSPAWTPISSLVSFLQEAFVTSQEFRDTTQATLPSYRERIVQVRLTDEEGGLNLSMPHEVIQKVIAKGARAGEVLLNDFDFQRHQWVRFRVLMAQMEGGFLSMRAAIARPEQSTYRSLLNLQYASDFPYRRDQGWTDAAIARLDRMNDLLDAWSEPAELFGKEPRPMPEPLLRVTPEL
jgi:predicted acylesterase/phospholipase RssA